MLIVLVETKKSCMKECKFKSAIFLLEDYGTPTNNDFEDTTNNNNTVTSTDFSNINNEDSITVSIFLIA